MISLMFQGFLVLLITFLIGLPLGELLARQVRRWRKRPRPKTERVQAMMAGGAPEPRQLPAPLPARAPSPPPVTYPVSVFGQTTISRPVRTDH